MASNSFGNVFRITTFGESHGVAIGVVIDGCPAGISLCEEDVAKQLSFRRPGKNIYTSPRQEKDQPQIISGVFDGMTTGAPITILIYNQDVDSSSYTDIKDLYRPGHANFTYLEKYGVYDYRGGGRASARETAARVAAGAVAKKLLSLFGIDCVAFLSGIGDIMANVPGEWSLKELREYTYANTIYCPDEQASNKMEGLLESIKQANDSIGGVVGCVAHMPVGLGDPVYCKLEALLAYAMLSIPATKGFEIGSGFSAVGMKGSEHNDLFDNENGTIKLTSNFSGGTLGGISTGRPLQFKVAFKPTSSIKIPQQTVNLEGHKRLLSLPENSRHDPCLAIRAVPVVEAMTALVLADSFLMNYNSKIELLSKLSYSC